MALLQKYVALLRGINVGGNNIIKMTALKACFEAAGFKGVVTYIQSGNVIFTGSKVTHDKLEKKIETILSKEFNYKASVVIVSQKQLEKIVHHAPTGFGKKSDKYRYHVLFLKPPLKSAKAIKEVSVKDGVDTARAGSGILYFSRLISKATQSHLSKIVQSPIYKSMTIRNWNTTTKLLALMERG